MGWAARRRFIILLLVGSVIAAFLAVIFISIFTKTPSCTDGIQNQNESGIDCGGSCSYLCTEEQRPPTVLFTKIISNEEGRTDVVASVENINTQSAAKNVSFTVTLYGANQLFLQELSGTMDLPPSSTVPVFMPGITTGKQKILRAFLSIASSSPKWISMTNNPNLKPIVLNTLLGSATSTPRIDAILGNSSVAPLLDIPVVIFVHDAQGEIIAASKTVVPTIPAQGQATATFTWNKGFVRPPAALEVIPIVVLP